jgi:hypothetical protein
VFNHKGTESKSRLSADYADGRRYLKQQKKIVGGNLTAADKAPSVFLAGLFHL